MREREREREREYTSMACCSRWAARSSSWVWAVMAGGFEERERESVRKNPKTPKLVVQRKRQPIMGVFIVVSISITGLGEAELRK